MPTIAPKSFSSGNRFQELPDEIRVKILKQISSPVDALSLSQTNRANHDLVANETRYWAQHGMRPPIAVDAGPKTWASKAQSMPRPARELLPYLKRPLDMSSRGSVAKFSLAASTMLSYVIKAEVFAEVRRSIISIEASIEKAEMYAKEAGVDLPPFTSEIRAAYIEGIESYKGHVPENATDSQIRSIWKDLSWEAFRKTKTETSSDDREEHR